MLGSSQTTPCGPDNKRGSDGDAALPLTTQLHGLFTEMSRFIIKLVTRHENKYNTRTCVAFTVRSS